jgi:hypothetical protein
VNEERPPEQGLCGYIAAVATCGQKVTFRIHDDEPVGPNGGKVKFDDERLVADAGGLSSRRSPDDWGLRRWPASWCGCDGTGRAR